MCFQLQYMVLALKTDRLHYMVLHKSVHGAAAGKRATEQQQAREPPVARKGALVSKEPIAFVIASRAEAVEAEAEAESEAGGRVRGGSSDRTPFALTQVARGSGVVHVRAGEVSRARCDLTRETRACTTESLGWRWRLSLT